MKIIIKLPVKKNGKFKLQSRGFIEGRQFKTANGLMAYLETAVCGKVSAFLGTESKEKIAIEVKEYMGTTFENVNETLDSTDREYLVYCTSCFLEDFLSERVLKKYIDRWEIHVKGGEKQ